CRWCGGGGRRARLSRWGRCDLWDHIRLDLERSVEILLSRLGPVAAQLQRQIYRRNDARQRSDRGQELADAMIRTDHAERVNLLRVKLARLFLLRLDERQLDARLLCAQRHRVQQLGHFFALRNQLLEAYHVLLVNRELLLQVGTALGGELLG